MTHTFAGIPAISGSVKIAANSFSSDICCPCGKRFSIDCRLQSRLHHRQRGISQRAQRPGNRSVDLAVRLAGHPKEHGGAPVLLLRNLASK